MPPRKRKSGSPVANRPVPKHSAVAAAGGGSGFNVRSALSVVIAIFVLATYSARVYDPEQFETYCKQYAVLKPLATFYQLVDDYSPFHEFINDDGSLPRQDVLLTKAELTQYDGSPDSKGLYLAVLGQVFDVSKGRDHYGPGGGYAFFSAKDGSRAFVSGQFDEAGLVDDVSNLSPQDYIGLQEWLEFYHKDYSYVGKVVGNFFDAHGYETEASRQFARDLAAARQEASKKNAEKKIYPPCNTEWNKKKGHRVWCTAKTGGQDRGWIGRPRMLFLPGRNERCACIKDFGPPSTDPSAKSDFGDLKSPHVREYDGCDPEATSCLIKPPEEQESRSNKDEL